LPQLGYFVLDVLQYDIEQMDSILSMLNATSDVGWRDLSDRDCTAPEVREVLDHLAGGGPVIPYADPLREQFLAECLEDMTAREWYELLNRKTFFWVSKECLERLLRARAYRNRTHDIVTVDTRQLVERDLDRLTLAPINTGSTL
jgi:hypothetical protein